MNDLRSRTLPPGLRYFAIRGDSHQNDFPLAQFPVSCLESSEWDGLVHLNSADFGTTPTTSPPGQGPLTQAPVGILTTQRTHTQQTNDVSAILCALDPSCFIVSAHSPIDIQITAPDGRLLGRQLAEIPGASHVELEDTSGRTSATLVVPLPLGGKYLIRVVPKKGVSLSDTYTLSITRVGVTTVLAKNHEVQDIPPQPYLVSVSPPMPIDIKPRCFPNGINPKSKGTIPVAILSSASFDAPRLVNKYFLKFGRTGSEKSLAFCKAGGKDVNNDGLLDLVCRFNAKATGFTAGDTQGVLTGQTIDGLPFIGTDSVRIISPQTDSSEQCGLDDEGS